MSMALALFALVSCDGDPPGSGPPDASVPSEACLVEGLPPMPDEPAACGATPLGHCPAIKSESCLKTPLTAAILELIRDCQVHCGHGAIAFKNGCVSAVEMVQLGAATKREDALACMRGRTIGSRWDCAPQDGWTQLFLASCTLE